MRNSPLAQQPYRHTVALPAQLLDHSTICIEEQLFSQAFALLFSALTSGTPAVNPSATEPPTSRPYDRSGPREAAAAAAAAACPAQLPPPSHLALAATLAVHPQLTTRARDPERRAAAAEALRYLRHVNRLAGSQGADFIRAFAFRGAGGARVERGLRAQARRAHGGDQAGDGGDEAAVRSVYAEREALWAQADDFWAVVGWALNSSVVASARWEAWRLWLDLMLDVLGDDVEARARGGRAGDEGPAGSLLAAYLAPAGGGRGNRRRLMRAVFADGGQRSLAEFPEIWRHETRPPKPRRDERMAKRRRLDLENGDFGDYFDDESDQDSGVASARRSRSATAPTSRQRSRAASERPVEEGSGEDDEDELIEDDEDDNEASDALDGPDALTGVQSFGGIESIRLRQRLIALLTRFGAVAPECFVDTEELFDLLTEFFRPLPLPVFQALALPSKAYLPASSQPNLNQMLLRPLLAAAAPPYKSEPITQEVFEAHYAPHAANNASAVDNAKVSLLVESLLRSLCQTGNLRTGPDLRSALERGIAARMDKVALDGRRKKGMRAVQSDAARIALECSAERMLCVLQMVEDEG